MLNKVLIIKLKGNVRKLLWTFWVCLIQNLKDLLKVCQEKSSSFYRRFMSREKPGNFMDVFGWSEGLLYRKKSDDPMASDSKKLKENSRIFLRFGRKRRFRSFLRFFRLECQKICNEA